MKIKAILTAAVLGVMTSLAPAFATPIVWSLNNFTFEDGAQATGSFTWETSSETISAFNINVSAGTNTAFPAFTYSDTAAFPDVMPLNGVILFGFPIGGPNRQFRFALSDFNDLNTASTAINVDRTDTFAGTNSFMECFNCAPVNLGSATAGAFLSAATMSAVPLPAGGLLLLSGLAGLAGLKRRKKAAR